MYIKAMYEEEEIVPYLVCQSFSKNHENLKILVAWD